MHDKYKFLGGLARQLNIKIFFRNDTIFSLHKTVNFKELNQLQKCYSVTKNGDILISLKFTVYIMFRSLLWFK
jgi:phage regulator Rha-like protein